MKYLFLILSFLFSFSALAQDMYKDLGLSLADKQHFKALVAEVLKEHNIAYKTIYDDYVFVEKDNEFGLKNILQIVATKNKTEWKNTISSHFSNIVTSKKTLDEANKTDTFELIKEKLRIRIFPLTWVKPQFKDSLIFKNDISETISVIMVDAEAGASTLSLSNLKKWNISNDTVWKAAKENLTKYVSIKAEKVMVGDDALISFFNLNDIYTSSLILDIENYKECLGKEGSLVSVPTRAGFICYPINDLRVTKMVDIFLRVTDSLFKQGPGQTSPHLYWYKNNKFHLQPAEIDPVKKSLAFKPTEQFIEMLNGLK